MNFCPNCASRLSLRSIDGEERLACSDSACGFVFWNNPVPVVAVLVQHQNRYLIARNVAWPEGVFSFITGYLEQGETPEQCVIREVGEELGLNATDPRLIGNYYYDKKNQVLLCYEVKASGSLVTNHELAEVKCLTARELADYDFSPLYLTQRIISDWTGANLDLDE